MALGIAALLMWVPGRDFHAPLAVAIGLFAAGLAIGIGAFLQFRRARTTINPMTPHASSALVTNGFYAWSRNPIYVADVIILVGAALLAGRTLAFLLVAVFVVWMDRFQIRPEERALRERFGEEYEAYCRKVRRWL